MSCTVKKIKNDVPFFKFFNYVINGYTFNFNKFLYNNIQRWACTKRMCKSYFKLNESSEIVFSVLNHSHSKDDENILIRQTISNELKRKALDDPYEKPCKILHRKLREGDIYSLITTDTMRIRKHIKNITCPFLSYI